MKTCNYHRQELNRMRGMLLKFMREEADKADPTVLFAALLELAVDIGIALSSEEQCVLAVSKAVNLMMLENHSQKEKKGKKG